MGEENCVEMCLLVWYITNKYNEHFVLCNLFEFLLRFVKFPRALASTIAGLIIGIWPALFFALAVTLVTVMRLPLNLYITYRAALTTVLLRPGLR